MINTASQLSSALTVCTPLLVGEIVYLDYPVYDNVGDLLIWHGTIQFLKQQKKKVTAYYSTRNISNRMHNHINRCFTICLQGGGNLGDLWPWFQEFREEIIQAYPNKRIVIFPQSVHFNSQKALEKACTTFKNHPDLHIFLRDKNSYAILEAQGVSNIQLCPDMAHALWGKVVAEPKRINSPLYLLRRDKEDNNLPPEVATHKPTAFDWDDLLTGWLRIGYKIGIKMHTIDHRFDGRLPTSFYWRIISWAMIKRAIHIVSIHDGVVTNRLHAMLLSALLSRNVTAYDNSYGKLSSYFDLWLKDIPTIDFRKT